MTNKIITCLLFLFYVAGLTGCQPEEPSDARDPARLNTGGHPAIEALTEKIAAAPDDPSLYAARAGIYYENEGYDEAIRDLQRAIELDTSNADYFHALADAYLDYYRSREALETMEQAAKRFPERIPTLLKLSEFQLILTQHEASMRTIDRILKIDPQNADAYFMFGMNFKEVGDTARAINSFQEATELNPDLIDAWINLGQLQAALGNDIAERYFNTALAIQPGNVEALHALADYLTDQDRLTEAIELYRRIATIDPQYEEAYYNAGLLYMELDSVQQAYRQFDLAIKTYPLHIRAYFYRGLAAEFMGRPEQARADYQQALQLAPDYELAKEQLRGLENVN